MRSDLLLWVIEHLFSLIDHCTPIAVSQILRHSHAFPRFLAEPVGAPRVGQALGAGGAGVAGPAPALARLRAEPAVLVAAVPADRLVAELSGGGGGAIAVVEDSICIHISPSLWYQMLGPRIMLVSGCENVACKFKQEW